MAKKVNIEKLIVKYAFKKGKEYEHTKRVVKLCEEYTDKLDIKNKKLLIKAAWLHDIGKVLNVDDEHHKRNIVKGVLKGFGYDNGNIDEIAEIIENHKSDFEPKNYILECAVLRICDKLDKYNKESTKKARRICRKNLDKILEYMEGKVDDIDFYMFNIITINRMK